jgi:alkylation response protein AidB-like acyl-CoA dehydrogenase
MMNFDLSQEQQMWREAVHDFAARELKPRARQVDEEGQFNWEAVRKMGHLGLLGLNVSEEYGGAGVDPVSAAIAIEELGWGCGSTALSISAHNGLGCAPITLFGTPEQQDRFLRPVVSAKGGLAALALTEPGAGSDLQGGVTTRAVQHRDEWIISGNKMWCTNASIADFIVTLVRTGPGDGSHSLSLFIVPTESVGLIIAPSEKKMGLKGSPTNAVTFDNVCLPADCLLGEQGQGLKYALTVLDGGRISIGALAVGLAHSAYEEALNYARQREAFGKAISEFQAIQWMLADAATEIQAARLMVYHAAGLKGMGLTFTKEAAMAKLFATEMAERVCRNAIQIHGGYGYSRDFLVELTYRDVRLMTIGEGTSEIQRLVIAREILQQD